MNIAESKKCITCREEKPLSKFHFRKDTNKRFGTCKKCALAKNRQWRQNNKEKVRADARKNYHLNPQKHRDYMNNRNRKDRVKVRSIGRKAAKKYRSTISGRLNSNLSSLICNSLRGEKRGQGWESLVGFTLDQLKAHLQAKFKENMTWDNYGKWHIDHIIPRSFFKFNNPSDVEFKYCWSLNNLQPLWARENKMKYNFVLAARGGKIATIRAATNRQTVADNSYSRI